MRYKLLVIGHMRHGKDTCAEILRDNYGLKFISSSLAASEIFIYDELKGKYNYQTPEECYEDRFNHRAEWFDLIADYNRADLSRLAKDILVSCDCYVGMRSRREIQACINEGIFDLIIWVDACDRLPKEDSSSFDIDKSLADVVIDNNGTEEQFINRVKRFGKILNN